MCNPVLLMLGATAVSGAVSAYGSYQSGVASEKYNEYLSQVAEKEGDLAMSRGEKQVELIQNQAAYEGKRQKIAAAREGSSERAAIVANGLDLSSVTAQDLASDSISKAKLDELAIRYNADINSWTTMEDAKYKKWGGKVQSSQYSMAGKQAKTAGTINAASTILSTASSMAKTKAGV